MRDRDAHQRPPRRRIRDQRRIVDRRAADLADVLRADHDFRSAGAPEGEPAAGQRPTSTGGGRHAGAGGGPIRAFLRRQQPGSRYRRGCAEEGDPRDCGRGSRPPGAVARRWHDAAPVGGHRHGRAGPTRLLASVHRHHAAIGNPRAVSAATREVSAWTTYRRLLRYLLPYKWVALAAVLGMIGDAGAMSLFARVIKPMLDSLFVTRDPDVIFWMPIIIVLIFLVRCFAVYIENYGTAYIGRGVVQRIRHEVFRHYLKLSAGFFDRESSGHQVARITYTSEQVASACTDAVKTTITDGL